VSARLNHRIERKFLSLLAEVKLHVALVEMAVHDKSTPLMLDRGREPNNPRRLQSQENAYGFQKGRLPMRIRPDDEVHSLPEFHFMRIEAAKVADFEGLNWHRRIRNRNPGVYEMPFCSASTMRHSTSSMRRSNLGRQEVILVTRDLIIGTRASISGMWKELSGRRISIQCPLLESRLPLTKFAHPPLLFSPMLLRVSRRTIRSALFALLASALICPESQADPAAEPARGGVVVRGEPGQRPVPVRAFQADVQTALLAAQPTPGVAGAALSAVVHGKATPLAATAPGEIAFVSPAPQTLAPALTGIVQQLQTRNRGWFAGKRLEFSIQEPIAPADALSSTLAIAVAVDAMLGGWTPDPKFFALGALEADGDIVAVSQPIPRIIAAHRAGAERIAVPERMWSQVADLLIAEGVASFSKAQMFTVGSFEEISGLATNPPAADIQRACDRFGDVQRALQAPGIDADAELLRPAIKDALREVLMISPRHLTARLLLGRTTGQFKVLSLPGSLAAIEAMGSTLLKAARSAAPSELNQLPLAPIQAEAARLTAARGKIDPKAVGVVDALIAYADVARAWHQRPAAAGANKVEKNRVLYAAAKQIRDELARVTTPQS